MVFLPALVLALSLGAEPAAPAAADLASRTVSVRIHDYAHLDEQELTEAQRLVSAIYEAVGVVLAWRTPARPAEVEHGLRTWPTDGAPALTILAITSGMSRRLGLQQGVAGYSAVSHEHGGRVCFIVADRTADTARRADLAHTWVLSSVIAHELAHLLMPNRSHSRSGLMRPFWNPWEFAEGLPRPCRATRAATSAPPWRDSPPVFIQAPIRTRSTGCCAVSRHTGPDKLANICAPVISRKPQVCRCSDR